METSRLTLRWLTAEDAEFILELVNDPQWLRHIGDNKVRDLDDAREYIRNGPVTMYFELGFGLYAVELSDGGTTIGICGLIKRESLDEVDLGFAFLPAYRGAGYARESAAGVMRYADLQLGLSRIVAITTEDNITSMKLLEKLGFRYERRVPAPESEQELLLFGVALGAESF